MTDTGHEVVTSIGSIVMTHPDKTAKLINL